MHFSRPSQLRTDECAEEIRCALALLRCCLCRETCGECLGIVQLSATAKKRWKHIKMWGIVKIRGDN